MTTHLNSKLDLTFERIIDVPPHLVWRAWTESELLRQWFERGNIYLSLLSRQPSDRPPGSSFLKM